jgi:hypothetical protein
VNGDVLVGTPGVNVGRGAAYLYDATSSTQVVNFSASLDGASTVRGAVPPIAIPFWK